MREAAALVAEELPALSTVEDPGAPLDHFPRQLDGADEVAEPLVDALWERLAESAVIPDANGRLSKPSELYRHPADDEQLATEWVLLASEDERAKMVHPSCLSGDRASRLNQLAQRLQSNGGADVPNLASQQWAWWFSVVAGPGVEKTRDLLKLVQLWKDRHHDEWKRHSQDLRVVPAANGHMACAREVVIATSDIDLPVGSVAVAYELTEHAETRDLLVRALGVEEMGDEVWRKRLDSLLPNYYGDSIDWDRFWKTMRLAPSRVRNQIIHRNAERIHLRRRDQKWQTANWLLIPGGLIAEDEEESHQHVLVDLVYHREDADSLSGLRVPRDASLNFYIFDGHGLEDWVSHCRRRYKAIYANAAREHYLHPLDLRMPDQCRFLPELRGPANARFTQHLLGLIGQPARIKIGHDTTPDKYEKLEVPHPLPWFLVKHRRLFVGERTVALCALVAMRDDPALKLLDDWPETKAILDRLSVAEPKVKPTTTDFAELWEAAAEVYVARDATDLQWRALWASAAQDDFVPASFSGSAIEEVVVTTSPSLVQVGRRSGKNVALLDDKTAAAWIENVHRTCVIMSKSRWARAEGHPAC